MSDSDLGYKVELDVFEGPLDLLLHLVRKHELDILDIPIAFVTEKYLEYLDMMTRLNLDVAGEYLLMAATLAHIKSRELLPPSESDDEADDSDEDELDPRAELIRRLLEYQKYKEAAGKLGGRPVVGRNIWPRGTPQEEALADEVDPDAMAPLAEVPVIKLIEALDRVLSRAKIRISHEVIVDRLSVSERINEIADRLAGGQRISFSSCFSFIREDTEVTLAEARHEAVVTFLAILEMAKLRLIELSQPNADEPGEEEIYIAPAGEDLRERLAETVVSQDEYR